MEMNRIKKKRKQNNQSLKNFIGTFTNKKNQRVFGFILILTSLYCFIAFTSFFFQWQEDQSEIMNKSWGEVLSRSDIEVQNSLGKVGALISHYLIYLCFGISSYVIPLISGIIGILLLGYHITSIKRLVRYSLWGIIWVPLFIYHIFKSQIYAGGIGFHTNEYLIKLIGNIGTTLLLIIVFLIFITLTFNITPEKINKIINSLKPNKDDILQNNPSLKVKKFEEPIIKEKKDEKNIKPKDIDLNINDNKKEKKDVNIKLESLAEYDPKLDLNSYKTPTLDLLNDYGTGEITIDKKELEENKQRIVNTLSNYKIGIDSITATIGPTITLYEIVPEAGIRISKIKNLEDDIALSLSAEGIRIIAPIPGKGTIGIEVPNHKPTTVSMLTVLNSEKFQNSDMDLPISFGKTISNETFIVHLAKMPHLLMAGATGQGKSVGLNAILTSLLYKKHPSEIKFVLVDPKKVELTLFNKIERHFLAKLPDTEEAIITNTKKVVNTINSLCIEMDKRYELLKEATCRNLKEYNKKFISRKLNPEKGHRYLPYIILVIDEFADLIMTAGKEIETPIARLAQLARAIGIHLIIATQRPSVNVITGIIKANFPARVAFRVTSRIDSRTILDTGGADQLIGKGDMLISTGNEITRVQCAFIDTPEVEKICEFIGSQRAYPAAYLLPEYIGESDENNNNINLQERDSLFDDAARLVVNQQSGSTSSIQRRMKIGYNRAGRIMDELESAGIVGPFEGSKARQVLIKNEVELEELLRNLPNNA